MKSGNLNFLEPSGPFQACNGNDTLFSNLVAVRIINPSSHGLETLAFNLVLSSEENIEEKGSINGWLKVRAAQRFTS